MIHSFINQTQGQTTNVEETFAGKVWFETFELLFISKREANEFIFKVNE